MSTMTDTLPIYYNTDVLGFYQKQKLEFHFDQKTDNEFLMFLLDSAVRVISIVQHLAPVIEAVSDASAENHYAENHYEEAQEQEAAAMPVSPSVVMEVDQLAESVIKEHAESVKIPPPAKVREPETVSTEQVNLGPIIDDISQQIQDLINTPTTMPSPKATTETITAIPTSSFPNQTMTPITSEASDKPLTEQYSSPSTQNQVYEEVFKEEVIEIKDEPDVYKNDSSQNSEATPLAALTPNAIQQLMNSVSNNEENVRIQNFVPTAMPSNLPPSFLDKSSNPLSMLSLSNNASLSSLPNNNMNISANLAGPSGIKTDGSKPTPGAAASSSNLNKSWPYQKHWYYQQCPECPRTFKAQKEQNAKNSLKVHFNEVHLNLTPFKCLICAQSFRRKIYLQHHTNKEHKTTLREWQCTICDLVITGRGHQCILNSKPDPMKTTSDVKID